MATATAVGFDLMKELAIRAQGRNPVFVEQVAYTGAPSSASDGVSVVDAIVTMIDVCPRAEVHNHASRVEVATYDLTTTVYTVTINGTAVAYNASVSLPATSAALIEGIANAINANGTVNLIVQATIEDSVIVLRNITGEANSHTTAVSVAGGTGTLTFDEDATGCGVRLFLYDRNRWRMINAADYTVDYRGFVERFETSGGERLYVEVYSVTGPASAVPTPVLSVAVGPCAVET